MSKIIRFQMHKDLKNKRRVLLNPVRQLFKIQDLTPCVPVWWEGCGWSRPKNPEEIKEYYEKYGIIKTPSSDEFVTYVYKEF